MNASSKIKLTVDAVIFSKRNERLSLLFMKRKNNPFKGYWALPGGFVEQQESLVDAALRELKEETGLVINTLEQLHTFGSPDRDPRGRVVTTAYFGIMTEDKSNRINVGSDAKEADWFDAYELPPLAFDHHQIVDMAIRRYQAIFSV